MQDTYSCQNPNRLPAMYIPFLYSVILLFAFVGIGIGAGYLLRTVLSKDHVWQARLTDEAISNRITYTVKNFKSVLALLLVLYFVAVTVICS